MSRQETRNGWSGNSRARAPMSEAMFAEGGMATAGCSGARLVCARDFAEEEV